MAARQDPDDDMDDIEEEIEDGEDLDDLLAKMDTSEIAEPIKNLTARRRIEELLEERRLRRQIDDYEFLDKD